MGNDNSGVLALLALLGVGYLVTRSEKKEVSSLNGSLFPWLSSPTVEKETITKEYHYITDTMNRVQDVQTGSDEESDEVEDDKWIIPTHTVSHEPSPTGYVELLKKYPKIPIASIVYEGTQGGGGRTRELFT